MCDGFVGSGSGPPRLSVEALPDLLRLATGFLAAQGEDAGGATYVPAYSGEFEALGNDGFAVEGVHVLAGVVEVHDVGCGGEVFAGQVPDPRCPIAEHDQLLGVAERRNAVLHARPTITPSGDE